MNMLNHPELVQTIEIMDGEHFLPGSMALFCFQAMSRPDARGYSLSVGGEVFDDAIWVNDHGYVERHDDGSDIYEDDVASRRIVATALFGYEKPVDLREVDPDQLMIAL